MSPKRTGNPESVHDPLGPYAHHVALHGPQRWLVVSGQVGMRRDGTLAEDVAGQLDVALENVLGNLAAAGFAVADLVKLTFFFVDEVPAPQRAEILARHLGDHRPAMTLTFVPRLAAPPIRVEVEAWAAADER